MYRIKAITQLLHAHVVPAVVDSVPSGYVAYNIHMEDEYCTHYLFVPSKDSEQAPLYAICDNTGLLCLTPLSVLSDLTARIIDTCLMECIINALFESQAAPVCPIPAYNQLVHEL